MDLKFILQELLSITEQQVSSVINGDHNRLLSLCQRHDLLMSEAGPVFATLGHDKAQGDDPETQELFGRLNHAHIVLKSLLQRESFRVNTQIRILAGSQPQDHYPGGRPTGKTARLLNTKA